MGVLTITTFFDERKKTNIKLTLVQAELEQDVLTTM